MSGIFITLEGPDGSGKSTIVKLLSKYLEEKKIDFIFTREPGGTPIGEDIRDIILNNKNIHMSPRTEALLYAASRSQHISEKIKPALEEGKVVICERFVLSSLAYQGVARGLGIEDVKSINDFAIEGVNPDLTLFFDVDPIYALNRKTNKKEGDRLEKEGLNFHKEVYDGYKELISMYPENIKVIDASKSVKETFEQVRKEIENIL
ncbi:dTMP kinase [Anaerosalibacter bizertensis]|uniref:Thymidylate kinase n=1 Tax=Anaerosalibacter bizertensis TaxID=932217 RepID=A0A9Q4FM45_9FIRM|nr:dTMP kinase [Anaerosalibacter bizertensis]MBV1819472.1 dTMP kinase [Bacteroidales bacterium MSK.15.36]MCB5560310.1 dTMP kinase [Anaerosalibacter bizertensis]MCG4565299.1 dTMP kinase [Anaerosalibacter bizertensis]MCG4582173.1 dTMP kinase [Anaerosalibacter bizertensis]MCG4584886.1 dTMP kinase [Anaerosalibacter bizertensis]